MVRAVSQSLTRVLRFLFSGSRPVVLLTVLLLISLYLLSSATHQSARFGDYYLVLLVVNVLAMLILVGLIVKHVARLLQQYRSNAPGSRLTLRLVLLLGVLSVTPVSMVYLFSLDFIQRGIDSWFDVRVEEALDDALELSRASLGVRMRDLLREAQHMALVLAESPPELAALTLNELRENSHATELTLYSTRGRILASSTLDPNQLVPLWLDDTTHLRLDLGANEVGLVSVHEKGLFIRAAVTVPALMPGQDNRILRALFPVTAYMNELADSVQAAFARYQELAYLRKPLTYSFVLTLSLVLLLSVLTAVLAALSSARRLMQPISDLAEGTRAVAAGDYAKRLPLPSRRDELGFLVRSFNDMTRRISEAQREVQASQRAAEEQRAWLEGVLANLSSGVITLDTELRIRTGNNVASQMLDVPLGDYQGRPLIEVVDDHTQLQFVVDAITPHLEHNDAQWSEEVVLFGPGGRRVFIWRGTTLSDRDGKPGGHVIVFDDITALVQAQRDAAWGEVARRLAHEIKNPLTPIQLSAERLRHKYLARMAPEDADVLDRSTRTIVQQVETLKEMVKAFSDYARMPTIHLEPLDLNQLVREVADLYDEGEETPWFALDLDPALPPIDADDGRLRQLLHNLFKNALEAVDFRPSQPVRVSTRCMQEANCHFIEMRVEDAGPGIPEDIMAQLFEPYVTTKPRGSGLGLAIVKKIVEEHGGMVWAENRGAKGGACLIIRLPVSREENPPRDGESGGTMTDRESDDSHAAA